MSSYLRASHKQSSELLDFVERFFGFGDRPDRITVVLPAVERRRPSLLRCENYPLFPYEISPDDVFTALRIYSMLVSLYGDRVVQVKSSKELLGRPLEHCVLIGSSVTNPFCSHALVDQYYSFGRGGQDHDILSRDGERYAVSLDGDDSMPLGDREVVYDYALISKHSRQGIVQVNLAGCRAYGQMALWYLLKDLGFYMRVLSEVEGKDFQILIRVTVDGRTCAGWDILDVRSGSLLDTRVVPPRLPSRETITWLHLSDLHFWAGSEFDSNIVLDALLDDVAHLRDESGLLPDFVVVTGDIAFSGKPAEYKQTSGFFDHLLNKVGLSKDRLFVVPGNHDVDRSLVTIGAKAISTALTDRNSTNAFLATFEDRRLVMARFKGYAEFISDYFAGHLQFDDEHYFYVQKIEINGHRIALLGLNSAWLCASDQDKANGLLIGERQIRTALEQAEDVDIRIALLHHPFAWLRDFDQCDSAALLLSKCDFVLHGHLHQTRTQQLIAPDSGAIIIAAGASYEGREYPNCYNFGRLHAESGESEIVLRRYSDASPGFWVKDTLTYKNAEDGTLVLTPRSWTGRTVRS